MFEFAVFALLLLAAFDVAVFALTGAAESVTEFESTTTAIFDATLALTTELAFALTSTFEFTSVAGAFSAGASAVVVCKTDTFPVKAGIARNKAESIKTVAAPIVIFDKIVCAPRG